MKQLRLGKPAGAKLNTYGCENFPIIKFDVKKMQGKEMEIPALMTVDERGATFSISDGDTQYSMPLEAILTIFDFVDKQIKATNGTN